MFRQVALKGNLLKASVAADLETAYTTATIGAAEMLDRGVQFPFTAVNDSLLAAGDKIVRRIGANPTSRYRKDFTQQTAAVDSGQIMPTDIGGVTVVGVPGTVKDAVSGTELEQVTRQQIDAYLKITLVQDLHFYAIDGTRIWHTRPVNKAKIDMVVWNKEAERVKLDSSPRGICPFTEDLHEALVAGALSVLFRSSNNSEQAEQWKNRFDASLDEIFTEV